MERKNCWEVLECGQELGGARVNELGVCPASLPGTYEGLHKGRSCGRCCWMVDHTFCNNKAQGTFSDKFMSCIECDFFKSVQEDESREFFLTPPKDINN